MPIYIPSLIVICIFIAWYVISAWLYRDTTYYKITHRSFTSTRFNKGNNGEYLIYNYLKKYEADGAKFLFNCYIPKADGNTSEIDVLMIHSSGIYVFESKNYSGWIFGSEDQRNWTQTLPNGKKVRKEHFYNPIKQNRTHIKHLMKLIDNNVNVHSIIVFSERCTLKKIDVTSPDIFVIKRNNVNRTINKIVKSSDANLEQATIENIYDKLYPYTQVSEDVKDKHVEIIKNK